VEVGATMKPEISRTRNCFKGNTNCLSCENFLAAQWWNTNDQQKYASYALGMSITFTQAEWNIRFTKQPFIKKTILCLQLIFMKYFTIQLVCNKLNKTVEHFRWLCRRYINCVDYLVWKWMGEVRIVNLLNRERS
jgi:hypothetical protein